MIPGSRQRNFLQSGLYVIIVGIVATLLMERLLTYAEVAEKAAMEATLSRLHAALYTRIAYLALRGDREAIDALPKQSPFATAVVRATNYMGEFVGFPTEAVDGQWFYDRMRHELVYVPRHRRFLRADVDEPTSPGLRFRLELVQSSKAGYAGVSFRPVGDARWDPLP